MPPNNHETAFENPGTTDFEAPAQFNMGENADGSFQNVDTSVGPWNPNADPNIVTQEDLQQATARIVRNPDARVPGGDGPEAMNGPELLGELREAISDFTGVGSNRETMSRLSRLNPFRVRKHTVEEVREAGERLDSVQEEVATRLDGLFRQANTDAGTTLFSNDAINAAVAANKLFGTFTVARLRKEYLENQADKSNSGLLSLGRLTGFLTRKVAEIDQKVEDKDITKASGMLKKAAYFSVTAIPLSVAGIAAAPLAGSLLGAGAIGAGAFAAARVSRGLFSAKVQSAANSINRAERDQLARISQQEGENGITSAFVAGGEAKIKETDKRLAFAAGTTAVFGAMGYFGGHVVGNIGRDIKDWFDGGDGGSSGSNGPDGGSSGGDQGGDSTGGSGEDYGSSDGEELVPVEPSSPDTYDDGGESAIETFKHAIDDALGTISDSYDDVKQKGIIHYAQEGADRAEDFGNDALYGVGADDIHNGPNGPGYHPGQEMAGINQRHGANFLVDATTGEKISAVGTLNVKPGGGFISTFQDKYGLSSQQANELYYRVEPHLRGMDGTYAGPGDVRISAPGELKLSEDARQAVHDELIKMGIAEDKQIRMGIADAKAVSGQGIDTANTTGGLEPENYVVTPEEAIKDNIDAYLDPERLQDDSSWDYIQNIISGEGNGAISAEQMSAIHDQVITRIAILDELQNQLDRIETRGNSADLSGYQDRLNLALERLENVRNALEETMRRSLELDSGE